MARKGYPNTNFIFLIQTLFLPYKLYFCTQTVSFSYRLYFSHTNFMFLSQTLYFYTNLTFRVRFSFSFLLLCNLKSRLPPSFLRKKERGLEREWEQWALSRQKNYVFFTIDRLGSDTVDESYRFSFDVLFSVKRVFRLPSLYSFCSPSWKLCSTCGTQLSDETLIKGLPAMENQHVLAQQQRRDLYVSPIS